MSTDLERLGRAIKQAQYRHHRALDLLLAPIGASLVQWDALRAIERVPGASAHELASATFQGDQAFGALAGRIEAHGWITRKPGRGRRLQHALTPAGKRVLAAGRPIVRDMLAKSFAPLGNDERMTLLTLLDKIITGELIEEP